MLSKLLLIIGLLGTLLQFAWGATRTVRVQAVYPRQLSTLFLRGNEANCGLTWSKGLKMSMSTVDNYDNSGQKAYVWTYDMQCASTVSAVELKVLIDDNHWMLGANHHVLVSTSSSSDSPSSFNSSQPNMLADTQIDTFFPWFYTGMGSLTTISKVYSPELKNFRDIIFYLPPSYNENTFKRHKNVLIMHDGQNLFNPQTSAFGTAWMCQNTLDEVIIGGRSDEVLVVGAYNTNDRNNEYTYIYDPSEGFGGKGDLYLDWIESTLIPLVGEKFRVNLVRESLGILGSSLGGLISCYAGWTRAKVYGKVGCMSSSFWWDDNNFQNQVIIEKDIDRSNPLPSVYMDSGTSGGEASCAVYTSQIYDIYVKDGFVGDKNLFKYVDQGAAHNEASWGARFYLPIQDLYPPSTV